MMKRRKQNTSKRKKTTINVLEKNAIKNEWRQRRGLRKKRSKGGSLKPQELKDFLQASYEKNAPKTIDNYILDDKLSNLYGKVYVNEALKKVV